MSMTRRYTIGSTYSTTTLRRYSILAMPSRVLSRSRDLRDHHQFTMASTSADISSALSLRRLARALASRGPLKVLPANKRVRLLFNGALIVDTSDALYVWEHEYYPQYYLPMKSFVKPAGFDVTLTHGEAIKDDNGRIIAGELELAVRREAGNDEFRLLNEMVLFAEDLEGPARMLRNFVKVAFAAVGASVDRLSILARTFPKTLF